jgi:hypothetical protein
LAFIQVTPTATGARFPGATQDGFLVRDHNSPTLESATEALADAAESAEISDKRRAALARQATAQIRLLAGQVREARRAEPEPHVHRRASLRPGF